MGQPRQVAYLLLRVTVGVLFLFNGLGKLLRGLDTYVAGMHEQYATSLPSFYVIPFAYVMPFAEIAVGTLLAIGLFTRHALLGAGLLMIAVTYGAVMQPDPAGAVDAVVIATVVFLLSWFVGEDAHSLDARRDDEET